MILCSPWKHHWDGRENFPRPQRETVVLLWLIHLFGQMRLVFFLSLPDGIARVARENISPFQLFLNQWSKSLSFSFATVNLIIDWVADDYLITTRLFSSPLTLTPAVQYVIENVWVKLLSAVMRPRFVFPSISRTFRLRDKSFHLTLHLF